MKKIVIAQLTGTNNDQTQSDAFLISTYNT